MLNAYKTAGSNLDRFRDYEIAYAEESWGNHMLGVVILVKMSNRKINRERDSFHKVADQIRNNLARVSAELDPNGPAMREACRADVVNIYKTANVDSIYMEEMSNGYCQQPCCLNKPWFRVTSKIGHVIVGWRKSVISIDWSGSIVKQDAETMFCDQNVTKFEQTVHAWNLAKASEYIQRLHELVGAI